RVGDRLARLAHEPERLAVVDDDAYRPGMPDDLALDDLAVLVAPALAADGRYPPAPDLVGVNPLECHAARLPAPRRRRALRGRTARPRRSRGPSSRRAGRSHDSHPGRRTRRLGYGRRAARAAPHRGGRPRPAPG